MLTDCTCPVAQLRGKLPSGLHFPVCGFGHSLMTASLTDMDNMDNCVSSHNHVRLGRFRDDHFGTTRTEIWGETVSHVGKPGLSRATSVRQSEILTFTSNCSIAPTAVALDSSLSPPFPPPPPDALSVSPLLAAFLFSFYSPNTRERENTFPSLPAGKKKVRKKKAAPFQDWRAASFTARFHSFCLPLARCRGSARCMLQPAAPPYLIYHFMPPLFAILCPQVSISASCWGFSLSLATFPHVSTKLSSSYLGSQLM